MAAAFRRLCVETTTLIGVAKGLFAAAFRRLCVETQNILVMRAIARGSRLQAAVC